MSWAGLFKNNKTEDIDKKEKEVVLEKITIKKKNLNKENYKGNFHIKYGNDILNFYLNMRNNFENNCYFILDKDKTNCYDFTININVII